MFNFKLLYNSILNSENDSLARLVSEGYMQMPVMRGLMHSQINRTNFTSTKSNIYKQLKFYSGVPEMQHVIQKWVNDTYKSKYFNGRKFEKILILIKQYYHCRILSQIINQIHNMRGACIYRSTQLVIFKLMLWYF